MEQKISFDIPYIRLRFRSEILADTGMPAAKTAALRGGMGEMLLRQNCVMDRKCEDCQFSKACVVRRTFYSYMEKKPAYVTGPESVGYLIECTDNRTKFRRGSCFVFDLVLFGESIVFFNIYLQAFCQLGMTGLGREKARFHIKEVRNTQGELVVKENEVDMSRYRVGKISDYIRDRRKELLGGDGEWWLTFTTPLSMKYQQEYMSCFYSEALVKGAARRVQMLDFYMGTEAAVPELPHYPDIVGQTAAWETVKRYSATKDMHMTLRGIVGAVSFRDMPEECLDYLIAGELTHIGRNTSFGFGKYTISREGKEHRGHE